MSINLHLTGYSRLIQTQSDWTMNLLPILDNRYEVLERYRQEYLIPKIHDYLYLEIKEYLDSSPTAYWFIM